MLLRQFRYENTNHGEDKANQTRQMSVTHKTELIQRYSRRHKRISHEGQSTWMFIGMLQQKH